MLFGLKTVLQEVLWIRIRTRIKVINSIRIRIKVISLIRICIILQMTTQNVWNISLFEPFFKVFSLYLEARIRVRIKVKGRIRIRVKVTSRIHCLVCNYGSENWNLVPVESHP